MFTLLRSEWGGSQDKKLAPFPPLFYQIGQFGLVVAMSIYIYICPLERFVCVYVYVQEICYQIST